MEQMDKQTRVLTNIVSWIKLTASLWSEVVRIAFCIFIIWMFIVIANTSCAVRMATLEIMDAERQRINRCDR